MDCRFKQLLQVEKSNGCQAASGKEVGNPDCDGEAASCHLPSRALRLRFRQSTTVRACNRAKEPFLACQKGAEILTCLARTTDKGGRWFRTKAQRLRITYSVLLPAPLLPLLTAPEQGDLPRLHLLFARGIARLPKTLAVSPCHWPRSVCAELLL
jgi:hypothetical protein